VKAEPPTSRGRSLSEKFDLQALSFSDKAIIDAYSEALKNGLSAAADANGGLVTASLAIATLYGTLIGLVSPKGQTSPFVIVLPMLPLVGAFLAAIVGKTRGISFDVATTTEGVRADLIGVVKRQRCWMHVAVALLTVGLVSGGFMLVEVYGGTKPARASETIYLTASGRQVVWTVCHRLVSSIEGTIGSPPLGIQDVVIVPGSGSPCAGEKIELTTLDVAAIR